MITHDTTPPNQRPGADAGWRVLFAFGSPRPRAAQADRSVLPITMKTLGTLAILAMLAMLTGCCATRQKGPAYGAEQEFRRQLEKSRVVTYYGWRVQEVRFSDDYEKALVVFAPKEHPAMRPEVVLVHNGFGKYEGTLYLTETGAKEDTVTAPETTIRVVFPRK